PDDGLRWNPRLVEEIAIPGGGLTGAPTSHTSLVSMELVHPLRQCMAFIGGCSLAACCLYPPLLYPLCKYCPNAVIIVYFFQICAGIQCETLLPVIKTN
ncbi:hypothetical protein AB205_0040520, partial [Aquarana catesbeiana]